MGLFDRKKKQEELNNAFTGTSSLFNDLTQSVAMVMYSAQMIKQPAMKYLYDDCGIFEGLYRQHTTNPSILNLQNMPNDTYLRICGMHAFGASIWTIWKAHFQLDKSVDALNSSDLYGIAKDFERTDAYELALRALNVPVDSQNKRAMDQIIVAALGTLTSKTGKNRTDPSNVRTYMQVLYNAGVTLMLGT